MFPIRHARKEIRVTGLQRSGNHAIINWIRRQAGNDTLFFNDVDPERPFEIERMPKAEREQAPRESYDCVLYSYEDRVLELINRKSFYPQTNAFGVEVDQRFDVVIYRNPFNSFASRLKHNVVSSAMATYISGLNLPELWLTYAYEATGRSSHMTQARVVVNYDRWCTSKEYRRQVAERLELTFTDEGFNEITAFGDGSSFDKTAYDSQASRMETDQRWKAFAEDPAYISLFADRQISDLTLELFPVDDELREYIENTIQPAQSRLASAKRRVTVALLPGLMAWARESALVKPLYQSLIRPLRQLIIARRS
jgi:hypothetical protein